MNKRIKNLTNCIFGKLKVTSFNSSNGKLTLWNCECECGNKIIVDRRELIRKDTRSRKTCGCRGYSGVVPGWFWSFFIAVTKRRKGKKFELIDITYSDLCKMYENQNRKCALSGVDITFASNKKNQFKGTNVSIDRKNSNIGYTLENTQLVHKVVNIMKNALSDEEFINWCQIITNKNFKEYR